MMVVESGTGLRVVDANKKTQTGTVVERILTSHVCQVESVLHDVNAQHALQTYGRTPTACLGIVGLNDDAQRSPRNNGLHRLQELIASGELAVVGLLHVPELTIVGQGISPLDAMSYSSTHRRDEYFTPFDTEGDASRKDFGIIN